MLGSSIKTQKNRGAGEKAVSKTLAALAEGHEFDPQHSCKRNGVHLESRWGQKDLWGSTAGYSSQSVSPKSVRDPVSNGNVENSWGKSLTLTLDLYTCIHMYTHICMSMHTHIQMKERNLEQAGKTECIVGYSGTCLSPHTWKERGYWIQGQHGHLARLYKKCQKTK